MLQFTNMARILNCDNVECPKEFERLESCGESSIRTCIGCFRRVLLVSTQEMVDAITEEGDPVAIQE